jgi:FkbM family methyltransferase
MNDPLDEEMEKVGLTETEEQFYGADCRAFVLLKRLGFDPDGFFDAGASNGCWSNVISKVFPNARFDLFEPLADNPTYHDILESHMRTHPNFHLHKIALGAESREIVLYSMPNPVDSTTLNISEWPHKPVPVTVPMRTIDSFGEDEGILPPQVLKMDVQGGELEVLKGAIRTLPNVDVIFCECWLRRGYGSETPIILELSNWLARQSFFLWDMRSNYRAPDGTLWTQDCLFMNVRCSLSPLKSRD